MTMKNKKSIGEQGTLLIEAIAMLGLIALVTPTLYKKSAERLQEIQDINGATQARTFNHVIETFIKSEFGELLLATNLSSSKTVQLSLDSTSASGFYPKGYSAYVPYGYVPGDIKNYESAKVYVRNDDGRLTSYIIFPASVDPGKKRASRMASLVGANGGVVNKPFNGGSNDLQADGTGGAWALDKNMLHDLLTSEDLSSLTENSLIVTSTEPISITNEDSDKFLYRVPPEASGDDGSKYYRNTMVSNLYMGGHTEESDFGSFAQQYYSIYNVRRLSLNTNCNHEFINDSTHATGAGMYCEPEVADLYIGKPFGTGSSGTLNGNNWELGYRNSGNTGAAWIYGNLSALKDNFRLFRAGTTPTGSRLDGYTAEMERDAGAYDVLEFSRVGSSSSDVDFSVFRAQNSDASAEVSMLDNFMVARMDGGVPEFSLGHGSSMTATDGSLIYAKGDDLVKTVSINGNEDVFSGARTTNINRQGGTVNINGSSAALGPGNTYINDAGGSLTAGQGGDWIYANGVGNSAQVYLLQGEGLNSGDSGDNRIFAVGTAGDDKSKNHMIWADSSVVSLRGGALQAFGKDMMTAGSKAGGRDNIAQYGGPTIPATLKGQLGLTSRYTDVLGSAYFGEDEIDDNQVDGLTYSRDNWRVGIGGSAWVDDLLFARDAWFHRSGFKELHAGFSSYTAYSSTPQKGWLNAYEDGVMIRNPNIAGSPSAKWTSSDTMFRAESSLVSIYDTDGAGALFKEGVAQVGYSPNDLQRFDNLFMADSSAANVIGKDNVNVYTGSSLSSSPTNTGEVNIQNNAMLFTGQAGDVSSSVKRNTIEARAAQFAIKTTHKGLDIEEHSQFYLDDKDAKVRYVDFGVYDKATSATVFKVRPDVDTTGTLLNGSSDTANVQVRGSFHVTGNNVIHVASNKNNRAGTDTDVGRDKDAHAMFEVDPEYVQIWAKDASGYAKGGDYFAMVKVNPQDIGGEAVPSEVLNSSSVYIRRGAIELEESSGSSHAANEGYGYIRANRFVSNATGENVAIPQAPGEHYGTAYDQYMVNPAYTSVMHDIKLTTRGGARLSDILPDYVLKGVYNLVNNRSETAPGDEQNDMTYWASPYIGQMPYAACPPGYRNLATVMPISFRMGDAGDVVLASGLGLQGGDNMTHRYVINPKPRHAKTLKGAVTETGGRIVDDLTLTEVSSLIYNEVYKSVDTFEEFQNVMRFKTEGWFWGLPAKYSNSTWTDLDSDRSSYMVDGVSVWKYKYDGTAYSTVPTPIYFQQNTWLKTSLVPDTDAWNTYMGFLYDTRTWGTQLGGSSAAHTVRSNYNQKGYNDSSASGSPMPDAAYLVWNMFPVPTYTLEGHGTVYCYFDREAFRSNAAWKPYIENIDQLGALKGESGAPGFIKPGGAKPADDDYNKRLHDPTLKYSDPW